MRRFGSFALAALLVTALGVSTSAAQKTFNAASGTAVVDGKMDDCYLVADEVFMDVVVIGTGKSCSSTYCAWDNDYLYVIYNVTDPVLSTQANTTTFYETDSVELFIDLTGKPNKDITKVNAAQYTAPAAIPGIDTTTTQGRGGHYDKNVANVKWATERTDNGYITEFAIPWGADFAPKAGAEILVAFTVNDDENGIIGREGAIMGNEGQGNGWQDSLAYDKLILSDKVYADPTASPDTADAGVIAALAALASAGTTALSLKKRK